MEPRGCIPKEYVSTVLDIQLFGAPNFTWNGVMPIELPGGKPMALLAYLVTMRQPQARDVLADLLWSELSNQQARNNLRYVLPELRKHLDDYLVISAQSIHFNDRLPYRLDIKTLRNTLSSPSVVDIPTLQVAVDLYQGEFLAGFRVRNAPLFEEWARIQQEEFHVLTVQGLQLLANRYLQQADYRTALTTAQRLVTLDPLDEDGIRELHCCANEL